MDTNEALHTHIGRLCFGETSGQVFFRFGLVVVVVWATLLLVPGIEEQDRALGHETLASGACFRSVDMTALPGWKWNR